MKKTKKYKIYLTAFIYSKKKGAYPKKSCIGKDISTIEDAVKYVKNIYPDAIETSPNSFTIRGLLYPGKIEIK